MTQTPQVPPPPRACRSCQAPIWWAKTRHDKAMPVDTTPSPTGDLVVSLNRSTGEVRVEKYRPQQHAGRRRYTAHWATCPQAAQHRQR